MYCRPRSAHWRFPPKAASVSFVALAFFSRAALPCDCLVSVSDRVEPQPGAVDIPTNAAVLVGTALILEARRGASSAAGLIFTDDAGNVFSAIEDRIETRATTYVFRSTELLLAATHYTASINTTVITDFTTGLLADDVRPLAPILVNFSMEPGSISDCAGIPMSTSSIGEFEVAGDGPYFLLHDLGDGLDPHEDVRFSVLSDSPFIQVDGTGCNELPSTILQSTNLSFSTMDAAFNESDRTAPILVRGAMPLLCECVSGRNQGGFVGPMLLALSAAFSRKKRRPKDL
jgi:hypothetical protein